MRNPWEARYSPEEPRRLDDRDGFERDRSRIIHSAAFRRLQAKTQVLGIGEGDFHRTRLTHSMEAAQISRGLYLILGRKSPALAELHLPPVHLLEAICLAHDLGHPPFGHTGEAALNLAMHQHGGFEGNGQTLRLLARLEAHTQDHGLNPTRRTMLGVLKYPVPYSYVRPAKYPSDKADRFTIRWNDWKPPKCFLDEELEIVSWILEPIPQEERKLFCEFKTGSTPEAAGKPMRQALDTSIMTIADDIAFGVHDLEDASALGLIERDELRSVVKSHLGSSWAASFDVEGALDRLFSSSHHERKQATGSLVNAFIQAVEWEEVPGFEFPLLKYNACLAPEAEMLLSMLKDVEYVKVIRSHNVQTLEYRGGHLVLDLFRAIAADPDRLLPTTFRERLSLSGNVQHRMRVICDYVSGMTDEFATKQYERLFVPRRGSALSPI